MKKKINLRFCLLGTFSVLLTAVLALLVFYGFYTNNVEADLKADGQLIAKSDSMIKDNSYLEMLKQNFGALRVTQIGADGAVLWDSAVDNDTMDNHLDRPEVVDALKNGEGKSVRQSTTLGRNTFYYAVRQPDGTVLRVSQQAHNLWAVFATILPVIALVIMAVLLLCLWLSAMLTRQIVKPILGVAEHIDDMGGSDIYDELTPFVAKIKNQQDHLNQQMETLREEKNKIQYITENMEEGLLLLNTDRTVLTVNQSAVRLLDSHSEQCQGRNILVFSRNQQLNDCVAVALGGESKSEVVECNGRFVHIYANPVFDQDAVTGALCMLVDVTDKTLAEQNRQEFSANVSHELKTPLTSISGYAELIENGIAKTEDISAFAARIHSEAQRLIRLINDIIKLSSLDQPGGHGAVARLNLMEVVRDCENSLRFAAEKKQVLLEICGEPVELVANRSGMEELICNLCDNAIRYNHPGGKVMVSVSKNSGQCVLVVADTGIGIGGKDQARIFERFYRVDKSRSKETGGTGLGLSIVKHIVEQHGGTIALKSEEGKGTEITVRLPLDWKGETDGECL